jgi:hypothetical protein
MLIRRLIAAAATLLALAAVTLVLAVGQRPLAATPASAGTVAHATTQTSPAAGISAAGSSATPVHATTRSS